MLFEFHNSFTFFLPAIPFPIHPAKQTVHFSPESLKPSIHTVCLEKQNRYLVDPKSFHRKLFDPADGLISHMEDHFIVLEQVDRLAQGELKELTSLLQNREGGLLAAVIINQLAQHLMPVQRASPSLFFSDITRVSDVVNFPTKDASKDSFPGDHGMMLLIFASFMWRYFGRRALGVALIIFVVFAFPRVMIGAHWFSDIAVGSLTAVLIGAPWVLMTPLSDKLIAFFDRYLPSRISAK